MVGGLAAVPWAGCQLDQRELTGLSIVYVSGSSNEAGAGAGGEAGAGAGDAGEGGDSEGGGAGAGAGGEAGSDGSLGGAGGTCDDEGGCGGSVDDRCPDLDGNDVLDCDETLAQNASFDESTASWTSESSLELTWAKDDAHDTEESGSLAAENQLVTQQEGSALLGARQCLSLSGKTTYLVAAEISVSEDAPEAQGGIQLLVNDAPDCAGAVLEVVTSNFVRGPEWSVSALSYASNERAKSAAVRLVALKPYRDSPGEVHFDNVLVRTY